MNEKKKVHEESTGEKVIDIGLANDFLDMMPNTQSAKAKLTCRTR